MDDVMIFVLKSSLVVVSWVMVRMTVLLTTKVFEGVLANFFLSQQLPHFIPNGFVGRFNDQFLVPIVLLWKVRLLSLDRVVRRGIMRVRKNACQSGEYDWEQHELTAQMHCRLSLIFYCIFVYFSLFWRSSQQIRVNYLYFNFLFFYPSLKCNFLLILIFAFIILIIVRCGWYHILCLVRVRS